ncbi:MAG: 50S ribosomal protein L24 [Chloroflexi bacterium]|nr:50S ribosomal protein L24 [Chloroflexota bacterium]
MKIKKNDNVMVIAGKDKGKKGVVRFSYPAEGRLLVEGINMIKRHTKARGTTKPSGILSREAPLVISNLMLVCPKCNKPSRVGYRFLEKGGKVRICKKCKEVID